MDALLACLTSLLDNPGENWKLFIEKCQPVCDQDYGALIQAGFDYEEDGEVQHLRLKIPSNRFGITPDKNVAAFKLKYSGDHGSYEEVYR